MTGNEYSGPVKVEGMVDFLHTLEEDVYVSQIPEDDTNLSGQVKPDTAAEYFEEIVDEGAEGPVRTCHEDWNDSYEGNGLLDPRHLEAWGGDSHIGELQLHNQELTEDGVSGGFDYKAVDGAGEECDITVAFEEENYDGASSDVAQHNYMSKAFREVGL